MRRITVTNPPIMPGRQLEQLVKDPEWAAIPDGDRSPSAQEVLIPNASPVVTLGPNADEWGELHPQVFAGAFVRLDPPGLVPPEQVARVKAMLLSGGAAAVWALPRVQAPLLPPSAVGAAFEAPAGRTEASHREVCMELLERGGFPDKEALRQELEAVLAEAGL